MKKNIRTLISRKNGEILFLEGKFTFLQLFKNYGIKESQVKKIIYIEIMEINPFSAFEKYSKKIVLSKFKSNFKDGFPIVKSMYNLQDPHDLTILEAYGVLKNETIVKYNAKELTWEKQ